MIRHGDVDRTGPGPDPGHKRGADGCGKAWRHGVAHGGGLLDDQDVRQELATDRSASPSPAFRYVLPWRIRPAWTCRGDQTEWAVAVWARARGADGVHLPGTGEFLPEGGGRVPEAGISSARPACCAAESACSGGRGVQLRSRKAPIPLAARSPTGTSAGRRRSPGRRNPQRRLLRATRLVPLLDGHLLTRPVTRWIETLCRSSRNRKYGVADLWQCWLGLPMRGRWSVHGPDLGFEKSADAGGDGQRPRSGASRIGPSQRQPRGPGRRRGRRHGH